VALNPSRFRAAMHLTWCMAESSGMVKEEREEELEEAKKLFKEGLLKIFKATKKVTGKIVEGFREGYAEDVTKKENPEK
jgi:hypothetical protein